MNKLNQINIIKIIYRSLFSAEGLPQLIINCVFIHNYGIKVLMIAQIVLNYISKVVPANIIGS